MGVPRVTVYLLVGLALGPHALLRWIETEGLLGRLLLGPATAGPLAAIEPLAIGFILFGIGAEFRFPTLRREGPRVLLLSATEIVATGLLAGLAVYAGTGDARLALIAPALAISSAPSATLVTLREVEADGPTSRNLLLLVGHNNLAALLLFPLLLALGFGLGHPGQATALAGAALVGGGGLGLLTAIWLESITGRRELVLLGILLVLAALALGRWLQPESAGLGMLACFAAGVALSNASPHAGSLFRYLENTVYPLYVLFFLGAGRDLHVEALGGAGVLGHLFVAARTLGKMGGASLGLRLAGWRERLPGALGGGLLCQAGIALGFVAVLEEVAPTQTAGLRQVVVASVVFFELVGPWMVRRVAVRAGEVKLANLVPHAEATGPDALRWVLLEMRRNLGLLPGGATAVEGSPTVQHAMRRRPTVLPEALPFDQVLKALGETGAELLPVVDEAGRFKGVLSYEEVKNTLYDPALRGLVVAGDLTSPLEPLEPDAPVGLALQRMDAHRVHSWPVVAEERLLGSVSRSDVYSLMRAALRRRPAAGGRGAANARG